MSGLIERAIAAVAPRLALDRAAARVKLGAMAGLSGYQAAKRERAATRNWNARARVADQDVLPDLELQRARSRELLRDAPLATGAVNTVVTNVVGTGLRLSSQPDRKTLLAMPGITADAVEAFEDAAEREWRMFTRREHCDSTGQLCFADMQELSFRAVLESGDMFVPFVRPALTNGPFDFALQLVEADRVCNPQRKADSDQIAGGVEKDGAGRPTAYHVAELSRAYPTGPQNWRRLAAAAPDGTPRVLHLMHMQRIGQSRGVPYLSPVVTMLKDLDRYSDAEITAAILNACVAIMGESATGNSPLKNEANAQAGGATRGGPLSRTDIEFESGLVLEGFMPGETLKSFGPARPNAGFDPFVQSILRQVGVALELPFEVLVKHFTASYSAARAALLQAWGFFRKRRVWLAGSFCQPVYEAVLMNAVARGRLAAPGFMADPMLRMAWCGARWTGPSPGQLDPLKEVNAAEKRIALRLSTRTRETAELTGEDWEGVAHELAGEDRLMETLGIEPEPTTAAAPIGHNGGPPLDGADPAEDPNADPAEAGDLEQPEAA